MMMVVLQMYETKAVLLHLVRLAPDCILHAWVVGNAPCTLYLVPCTLYLVPCTLYY